MRSAAGALDLTIPGVGDDRRLEVSAADPSDLRDFEGTATLGGDRTVLHGPLSEQNARGPHAPPVGFAPRYIGGFEKGIDYICDTSRFFDSLVAHAAIARVLGPYKMKLLR